MVQQGRKYNAISIYRYGFNGKENDKEIKGDEKQQDFGLRIYDPRLGRFLSIDPFYKTSPGESNYVFAGNSPVHFLDQEGGFRIKYNQKALKGAGVSKLDIQRFESIIKNVDKLVKENPNVLDALIKSTGLSKDQILKDFKFNESKSTIIDVTFFGPGARGGKDGIVIDAAILKSLGRFTSSDKENKLAEQTLGMALTIIHKYTHVGDVVKNGKLTGQYTVTDDPKKPIQINEKVDGTAGKQDYKWSFSGHRGDDVTIIGFGVVVEGGLKNEDGSVIVKKSSFGPEQKWKTNYPAIPKDLPENAKLQNVLKTLNVQ
jgi:RHS repeat-associated protein